MLMNITGRGNTLLDEMSERCTLLSRAVTPDMMGGTDEGYTDESDFWAVIRKDSTTADRIAEKQGVAESFTVVVTRGTALKNTDVFRREKDGKTYRVTSNIQDKEAPARSTVRIGAVTAERWDLPHA